MHERAGEIAQIQDLINVDELLNAYYENEPDINIPTQLVSFGTSGHRGCSLDSTFNEAHIVAITQAIVEYRKNNNITGPLFLGRDTHPLSEPAFITALQVLLSNDVKVIIDKSSAFTPTPVISHAILRANTDESENVDFSKPDLADGIVITPSHNPPKDGGFKYNPPHGGPADGTITKVIAERANEILRSGWKSVEKLPESQVITHSNLGKSDLRGDYISDLGNIIDFNIIREKNIKIGVHPLGGASVEYWEEIAKYYNINLTVIDPVIDPTWAFMPLDWDGAIRMDCSSPYAMRTLTDTVKKENYDIGVGNDADADRHGIVTVDGLMNPNHYLAVAVEYLSNNRPLWKAESKIGKTLVSSSLIDRVCEKSGKELFEVPVGFKYFTNGLLDGSIIFCGEESAGATFLRHNGKIWTTDKDGLIMGLLAAEIMAKTGLTPSQFHKEQTRKYGETNYARIDEKISKEGKVKLLNLVPDNVKSTTLGSDEIKHILVKAPGDNQPIGGLKITTENAWITIRPSGTEDVYKIYAESFKGAEHLKEIQAEAKEIVDSILG
ncbi:alpha-D-glucose phosphate-specific phosphoglucomutase [Actinomyces sp. zg-332]|uniref:phosphoglucomutase (alpha-D-glucose-1,6-bisphosphate-dependent) n=1 Tax=Actinomyces sp. zg-332 TaxID=2708340 RepID=UPI001423F66F|nr:phosphoglucomutase (alpha-D-glucose-1,6-bisphosphate-dependent) [Actinomyces sp. zg-332]QPK94077.1 alpha-D-glucose phosphate-specific phosphoglucomutase [Actinomyces sp. zg-332]